MSPRALTLSCAVPIALIVLLIVPVYAAPGLRIGSNANYNVAIRLGTTQSCNASPLTYNQTACRPAVNPPPWSFRDDFNYASISQLQAAGWPIESIAPISYYAIGNSTLTLLNDGSVGAGAGYYVPPDTPNWSVSGRIEWIGSARNVSSPVGSLRLTVLTKGHLYDWLADGYYGNFGMGMDSRNVGTFSHYSKQLYVWHTLEMSMIGGTLRGYFDGSLIGSYAIPDTSPGNTDLVNIQALAAWETNNEFDWMQANSLAAPVAPSGPTTIPPVSVSGSLGWTMVGLGANTAVLNVSHTLGMFVDDIPVAPVSESGSFQQSVNLSTRAESLGTSAELVDNIIPLLASELLGASTSGALPTTSLVPSNLPATYIFWWVNGPLVTGSPIQILAGYSNVQGDETVNLPESLGPRSAWVVSSSVAESLSTILPSSNSSLFGGFNMNNASARLVLRFDFDKSSDLLLASSDSAVIAATSNVVYQPGQVLCGLSGQCTTVSTITTVTKVITVSITASLTLSSTNLNLTGRVADPPSGSSTLSNLQRTMLQPLGIALASVAVAAIALTVVLVVKHENRNKKAIAWSAYPPAF